VIEIKKGFASLLIGTGHPLRPIPFANGAGQRALVYRPAQRSSPLRSGRKAEPNTRGPPTAGIRTVSRGTCSS
jgi:hypothetical protein